jgi:hypothetical protein
LKVCFHNYFCNYFNFNFKGKNFGDISSRLAIREQQNCKSFKWYFYNYKFLKNFSLSCSLNLRFIDNVWPDVFIPDENVHAYGHIINLNPSFEHKLCFDSLNKHKGIFHIGVFTCTNISHNQVPYSGNFFNEINSFNFMFKIFSFTKTNHLKKLDNNCAYVDKSNSTYLLMRSCIGYEDEKFFHYNVIIIKKATI